MFTFSVDLSPMRRIRSTTAPSAQGCSSTAMTTSFGSQFLHAIGPNVFSVANPLSHFNVYDVEEVARFCHFALAGMVGTQ